MSKQPKPSRTNRRPAKLDALWNWLPVLRRAVAVPVVSVPAVGKSSQYSDIDVRHKQMVIRSVEVDAFSTEAT